LKKESIIEEASKFQKNTQKKNVRIKETTEIFLGTKNVKWIITTPRGRGWMEAHPFRGTSWKYPSH
jgi:hypothetical protein